MKFECVENKEENLGAGPSGIHNGKAWDVTLHPVMETGILKLRFDKKEDANFYVVGKMYDIIISKE